MKSVEQVLSEPSPATVNYRSDVTGRDTLKSLIDGGPSHSERKMKTLSSAGAGPTKLNWVNGVFIPVLLNIWGVIMFLRLGWVVGQAGLLLGSVIIIGANIVTGITALSLCAICTNGEVKGGGVYFLISRALGPVYGGTIGILFFVAQAVAVSLYVVGFAEAVVDLIIGEGGDYITGNDIDDIRLIGFITSLVLFLMSLIGIGWYAKTQTALLVILLAAILSVYIGAFLPKFPKEADNLEAGFVGFRDLSADGELRNLEPNFQVDPDLPSVSQGFFTVFAVFFPAVTGIMAGANLSGDLDDASKAIPKGTLSAIVVTFFSYMLLLWIIGLVCVPCADFAGEDIIISNVGCNFNKLTNDLLATPNFTAPVAGLLYDRLIMKHVSLWSYLVYIGVFAATLSSALASLVGAPRILQSVAEDKLFPFKWFNFFAAGRGPGKEPVRGYCLTFLITIGCVSLGKLDVIAPIITNFFMISYALTNYACFASSTSRAPNWRPSFKYYSKYLSLVGSFLCLFVMVAIDWRQTLITIVFALLVMYYLTTLNPDINWGEAGEAKKYTKALNALETLQLVDKVHVKTFRPSFLVMTGDLLGRIWLVKFVSLFQGGGGGIMICADVMSTKQLAMNKEATTKKLGFQEEGSDDSSATGKSQDGSEISSDIPSQSTVRDLFKSEKSGPENGYIDEGSSSDETYAIETAKQLAAEYEFVKERRRTADTFLNNKAVWGSKRCKGAFFDAVISPTLFSGFQKTLQLSGVGKMRPNTVVVGFKGDYLSRPISEIADYEKLLRAALSVHLGLMVVRDDNFVFELNLSKTSSILPSFNQLITRPDEDDSDAGDKKDMESGLFDQDFKSELGTLTDKVTPATSGEAQNFANGTSKSSVEFKERIERYKTNDLEYMNKFENSLPTHVAGDSIDVWWLADDGGLTMLLPQLLIQNPLFKGKNLRVMAVTTKFQNAEETSRLKKAEFRMVHLLHKFRIRATTVGVDLNLDNPVQPETLQRFEKCMGVGLNDLDELEKTKTKYNLRLSEEIRKHSRGSSMVFMILPIPEITLSVKLHTVWLDMISHDMPPMVMMRGNNENVLTFFC